MTGYTMSEAEITRSHALLLTPVYYYGTLLFSKVAETLAGTWCKAPGIANGLIRLRDNLEPIIGKQWRNERGETDTVFPTKAQVGREGGRERGGIRQVESSLPSFMKLSPILDLQSVDTAEVSGSESVPSLPILNKVKMMSYFTSCSLVYDGSSSNI